jgi:hypothetical protein
VLYTKFLKEGEPMKRIEISVQNLVAWQTNSTDYICGNSKFVVGFNFDKEWDEFETKTARFIHGGEHTDIVFTGNECKVPKITNTKRIEIGVYAGDLQTTTPAVIQCRKSILCGFGVPADPPPDVYAQIMERLDNGVSEEQIAKTVEKYMEEHPIDTGSKATIGVVELPAAKWVGGESLYSQIVTVAGATENSQVDLTPSVEQLVIFYEKDLTFVTENEGGVVTVYAIGQKPENDYTIQVTITEVSE